MNRSFKDLEKVLNKAHLMTMGYTKEELDRPIIAVVNTWSEINQGHGHLRKLSEAVKRGILAEGGFPLEFNTIGLCDALTGWYQGSGGVNYTYPSRDLIADSVETMIRGQSIFSGMVLIATCDKIVPAMLQSAARLNIPSIFVSGGPCSPMKGKLTTGESQKAGWVRKAYLKGEIDEDELLQVMNSVYNTTGSCPVMGTANTMTCMAEALGMSLPGTALIPAHCGEQMRKAQEAGKALMMLLNKDIRPKDIMTRQAFENSIKVLMALGGSTNSVMHIPAIAKELSIDIDYMDFSRISREIPFICPVIPNGDFDVIDLHLEGGIPMVMKKFERLLNLDVMTVTGKRLGNILSDVKDRESKVIRNTSNPVSMEGGISILFGNIAPEGAVVKQSAVHSSMRKYRGRAVVFRGIDDFTANLNKDRIKEGSVVVVNHVGEIGAPGMPEIPVHLLDPLVNMNAAVITDGRFSGTFYGLIIGYAKPEAARGGNIGLIADGDEIEIDLDKRTLNLLVSEEAIKKRSMNSPEREITGYLKKFASLKIME